MNLCDAVIIRLHYIKKTSGYDVPECAKWVAKYTYNCYGRETTTKSYGYCSDELVDKYSEGKMILV